MRDDVWRAQIRHTVKKHLEKDCSFIPGMKVLSLFLSTGWQVIGTTMSRQADEGNFAEGFEETLADLPRNHGTRPSSG